MSKSSRVKYIDMTKSAASLSAVRFDCLVLRAFTSGLSWSQRKLNNVFIIPLYSFVLCSPASSANPIGICTTTQKLTSNPNITGPTSVYQRRLAIGMLPKIYVEILYFKSLMIQERSYQAHTWGSRKPLRKSQPCNSQLVAQAACMYASTRWLSLIRLTVVS